MLKAKAARNEARNTKKILKQDKFANFHNTDIMYIYLRKTDDDVGRARRHLGLGGMSVCACGYRKQQLQQRLTLYVVT